MAAEQKAVATVGYGFAFIFMILVLFVAVLFLVPGASFFGVSALERQSYMTYSAADNSDIEDLLNCRNIIIESRYIDIEIRVRKAGQLDVGTIQVWEDSSGLTFNSIKRTRIEWMQVIIENEDGVGEVFYKLVVREPEGIVSRSGRIYINMYPIAALGEQESGYNFLLNTGESDVVFASDDVTAENNFLLVDTITLGNATGQISFPEPRNEGDFYVDVGSFVINGDSANLDAGDTAVRGDVNINGGRAKLSLGDVDGDINIESSSASVQVGAVSGDVNLKGNINFSQKSNSGVISGNVDFRGEGSLEINGCSELFAETKNASVTVSGECGKIDFTASGNGRLRVGQIGNEARLAGLTDYDDTSAYNSVIKSRTGAVELLNVWTDVSIDKWEGSGLVSVSFAEDIDVTGGRFPRLKVRVYDSPVKLDNVCGEIDVLIRANGRGNVDAAFRRVTGESEIRYDGSTLPHNVSTAGNVKVTFTTDIPFCELFVKHNSSGRNYSVLLEDALTGEAVSPNAGMLENGGGEGRMYNVNRGAGGGVSGTLTVDTANSLAVYSRAASRV